tara:strand:- start:48 stop:518 length:471 start_codon:yes stop_codon:yes gene_type:complete
MKMKVSKMKNSIDKKNSEILKMVESIIGNSTTTNFDLNNIGKKLFSDRYLGTFASDKFPKISRKNNPKYCILNLDKTGMPGSHWVSCVILSDKVLIYDSFGRKSKKILPETFKKNTKIIDTEYDSEQDIMELNCGARCIAALVIFDEYGTKSFLEL